MIRNTRSVYPTHQLDNRYAHLVPHARGRNGKLPILSAAVAVILRNPKITATKPTHHKSSSGEGGFLFTATCVYRSVVFTELWPSTS